MSPDWSASPAPVPYADFSDPQTLNLYGYVRNDPLLKADVDGHCGPLCALAGGLIGGAIGVGGEYLGARLAHRPVTQKALAGAFVKGAAVGAVAGLTGGASLLVTTGAVGGANVAGGIADRAIRGESAKEVLSPKEVAKDAVSGAVGGAVGAKAEGAGQALANGLREMAATPGALTAEDAAQALQTAESISSHSVVVSNAIGKGADLIQATAKSYHDKMRDKEPNEEEKGDRLSRVPHSLRGP